MGTDTSADSGAKTDRGGTMPPSLGRDWQQCDKSKRVQSVAYITNRKVHFRLNHYTTMKTSQHGVRFDPGAAFTQAEEDRLML